MKKLLIFLPLLVLAGCEQGSYFNSNTKQLSNDAVSRVEASGEDFRVYEFTPQSAPHMQCVFVAASQKGGLFCFPK